MLAVVAAARVTSSAALESGGLIGVDHERDGEDRLEVGLVPAREGPAGVGGLELGGGDDLLDAVGVGERRPVEAVELVVEDAGELGVEDRRARGQRGLQRDRQALGVGVGDDRVGVDPGAAGVDDPGLGDLELDGVEHQLVVASTTSISAADVPSKANSTRSGSSVSS